MNPPGSAAGAGRTAHHARAFLLLLALMAVLDATVVVFLRFAARHGLSSELDTSLAAASYLLREHHLPASAGYPPGVPLLLAALEWLGVRPIDPFVFGAVLINLGVVPFFLLALRLLGRPLHAFAAVLAMVLNPIFVDTALSSRDVPAEFALTGVFFLLLTMSFEPPASPRAPRTALFWVTLLTLAALTLTRITAFYSAIGTLAFALLVHPPGRRLYASLIAGAVACSLLLCAYNWKHVGAFSMATSAGINLYFGNHPQYIHGHPKYDIDVFLGDRRLPVENHEAGADTLSEAALDTYFRRKGMEFIARDPVAFVYRVLVKSTWHWFNLERIPNYWSVTHLDARREVILLPPRTNLSGAVAYMLYKVVYLPLFVLSMVLLARGRLPRTLAVFYAPYVVLWPILAMTYPDTRYKLLAEMLACVPMTHTAVVLWRERGRAK